MKTTIGVYDNHELALNAVMELKNAGYPVKHISIMGRAETEVLDNDMHIAPKSPINVGGVAVGAALGATVGVLTGAGVFAVPGLGLLMGAGALVGAIAGLDFGIIGGGLATVLINLGLHEDAAKTYHDYLQEGKFLLIVTGNHGEINQSLEILTQHGTHTDLEAHSIAEKVEQEHQEKKQQERDAFLGRLDTQFPLSGGETEL